MASEPPVVCGYLLIQGVSQTEALRGITFQHPRHPLVIPQFDHYYDLIAMLLEEEERAQTSGRERYIRGSYGCLDFPQGNWYQKGWDVSNFPPRTDRPDYTDDEQYLRVTPEGLCTMEKNRDIENAREDLHYQSGCRRRLEGESIW